MDLLFVLVQCAKRALFWTGNLLSYNQLKNRIVIALGNPFVRSLDIEFTNPNIHTLDIVVPLQFGKTEKGPPNQMQSNLPPQVGRSLHAPSILETSAQPTFR